MNTPEVVRALRREMDNAALRVRNGISYARGQHSPSAENNPRVTVWTRDKVTLWRYRSEQVRIEPPLLVMMGLVSRPDILDLLPDASFIGSLIDSGFNVYLLDWGVPDESDAANTLETYVSHYLPRVVNMVCADSACESINLVAYCMGAQLALLYLAQRQHCAVRALVMLAPPIDFSHMGPLTEPLADGSLAPELLIDDRGLVPAQVVGRALAIKKPTYDAVRYANLLQKLANEKALADHAAITNWVRDHIPFPGGAFGQLVQMFFRDNAFVNGTARIDGRPAKLADISVPMFNVIAERDEVVPAAASTALAGLVRPEAYEELRLPAGHIGLVIGRTARQVTIPAVVEWLARHSDRKE